MAKLRIQRLPAFERDVKRLRKKHVNESMLAETLGLIIDNSENSLKILKTHHKMHILKGKWQGSYECHVCNVGDWLLVWIVKGDTAYLQRTGSHDDIFVKDR